MGSTRQSASVAAGKSGNPSRFYVAVLGTIGYLRDDLNNIKLCAAVSCWGKGQSDGRGTKNKWRLDSESQPREFPRSSGIPQKLWRWRRAAFSASNCASSTTP